MKFEAGKYFIHTTGRKIAVLGVFDSYRWGPMAVVEVADEIGMSLETIESPELERVTAEWTEIGVAEWMTEKDASCYACGRWIGAESVVVITSDGPLCENPCHRQRIADRGAENVVLPN